MADDRDDLIRSRAYEIWESEGSPHGRHDDHWTQASREIGEAQDEAAADAPASEAERTPAVDDSAAPVTAPASAAGAQPAAAAKRGRKPATVATPPAAPKGRRKKEG